MTKLPFSPRAFAPRKPRKIWLGNRTGTPRMPGASRAHRETQVSGSSYKPVSLAQVFRPQ